MTGHDAVGDVLAGTDVTGVLAETMRQVRRRELLWRSRAGGLAGVSANTGGQVAVAQVWAAVWADVHNLLRWNARCWPHDPVRVLQETRAQVQSRRMVWPAAGSGDACRVDPGVARMYRSAGRMLAARLRAAVRER